MYIWKRLTGYISFPRSRIGTVIKLENGNEAEIFRQVIFKKPAPENDHAVLFHVKFHLEGMSPKMNKWFSNLPIPFFVGLPGFCAKFWCLDTSNGDWHGFYKWRSEEHAEKYSHSFAMRFMAKRSVPGSVSSEILPYRENKYNAYPDLP